MFVSLIFIKEVGNQTDQGGYMASLAVNVKLSATFLFPPIHL